MPSIPVSNFQSNYNRPIYKRSHCNIFFLAVDQGLHVSYSVPMRLPFHKNVNFTGRERELAEIHTTLYSCDAATERRRVVVLHCLGGIGKTQLAIQYAYDYQKDYTSIWWVNASTTQTLSQGFLGIAQQLLSHYTKKTLAGLKPDNAQIAAALGLPPDVVDRNGKLVMSKDIIEIVNAVIEWFAVEDNNQWLLVIDNYDDLTNVKIYEFLHSNSSGSILITNWSRDSCRIGKALEVQVVVGLKYS